MADTTPNGASSSASHSMATSKQQTTISATYLSTTNEPFTISLPLTGPVSESVEAKTTYLRGLRQAVVTVQEEVNKELTARMEQDKARDAAGPGGGTHTATGTGKGRAAVDEAKEEENYGEEVPEEDED